MEGGHFKFRDSKYSMNANSCAGGCGWQRPAVEGAAARLAAASPFICSKCTPEGKARARRAEVVDLLRHASDAAWFSELPPSEGPQTYLVLGATPDEDPRGRTHYKEDNVWLLGIPTGAAGVDTSRFINADYSADHADELRTTAEEYAEKFNQIAFDSSTMCAFYAGTLDSMADRFNSFYIMLKNNGIFFVEAQSQEITAALIKAGFNDVRNVTVRDLGSNTILSKLRFGPGRTVTVGIKRVNPRGGKRSTRRSRRRSIRHRKFKVRTIKKN